MNCPSMPCLALTGRSSLSDECGDPDLARSPSPGRPSVGSPSSRRGPAELPYDRCHREGKGRRACSLPDRLCAGTASGGEATGRQRAGVADRRLTNWRTSVEAVSEARGRRNDPRTRRVPAGRAVTMRTGVAA